jgi:hypothetical protein
VVILPLLALTALLTVIAPLPDSGLLFPWFSPHACSLVENIEKPFLFEGLRLYRRLGGILLFYTWLGDRASGFSGEFQIM